MPAPDPSIVWAVKAGGTRVDHGYGVTVDVAHNTFVTGAFEGAATFGGTELASSGSSDVFVMKLDASGAVQWAIRAGGSGVDYADGIALDASGSVAAARGRDGGTFSLLAAA